MTSPLYFFFADVFTGMIIERHFFEELLNFGTEIEITHDASDFIDEVFHGTGWRK